MTEKTAKAIIFTDWDGTITLQDSNDFLTDNFGFGKEERLKYNEKITNNEITFKDGFQKMIESFNVSFDEGIDFLKQNVKLDPEFENFCGWCNNNDIPIVIISSGMKPIILELINTLIKTECLKKFEIISNDVEIDVDKHKWNIQFLHPKSEYGHDKAHSIKKYLIEHNIDNLVGSQRPILYYCGDGISDFSCLKHTDFLFAKNGKDLAKYCEDNKIQYIGFDNFDKILQVIKSRTK